MLDEAEVDRACPAGLLVLRRDVDADASWSEQEAALSGGWAFSPWTVVWLRSRIDRHDGTFPVVATVGGFVVAGADLVGVWPAAEGRWSSQLRPAGAWFADLRAHRLLLGAGRDWVVRGWQPSNRDVGRSGWHLRPRRQEPA